ncbi:MAG: ATP-binding protein [Bacillota bacterium]
MHHYHSLQRILDAHPMGAPMAEEFMEILKILFKSEEVELAVALDFRLKKLSEVAERAEVPAEEALKKLEEMANRGSILAKKLDGEPAYALLPIYPGLFEYPIMKGMDSETQKRLAELWHAYYMKAMAAEIASAKPPWNRVFPAEESLTEEYEILPYEVVSEMMKKVETIAVANCPCRVSTGRCDKPLDVCLSFDGAARFLSERGMARIITREEAAEVLKRSEEAGLVHTGSNMADRLVFVCNCCSCCCHFLRLITEHNYTGGLAKSSYIASLETSDCSGCGVCAGERCPVKAIAMVNGFAELSPEKCIGCGLCSTTCPIGALKLTKRENYQVPPATAGELVKLIVSGKKK